MIRVQVPATSANMGPGFDTMGIALSMHNTLLVEETEKDIVVDIVGQEPQHFINPSRHLIVDTIHKIFALAGKQVKGLHLICENTIPFARGLGSSSAAIVSGLFGGNALLGYPFTKEELIKIATEIEGHPDNVVPAICGGFTVASKLPDAVYHVKCDIPATMQAVVAIPDFKLSTAKARAVLPQEVPLEDAVFNMGKTAMVVAAAMQQDFVLWGKMMEDRLHQPYRFPLIPGADKIVQNALSAGALSCVLSGAGPTMIAWVEQGSGEKVAAAMEAGFQSAGVASKSLILSVDNQGVIVSYADKLLSLKEN